MDQSFYGKTEADRLFAQQLTAAIESVHSVHGITSVPIERKPLPQGWNGQFDPYTRIVTVSPGAPLPLTTGVHEIGHAIDALFLVVASKLGRFEGPISLYASQYAVDYRGILTDWLNLVLSTRAVIEFQQIRQRLPFMSDEWNEVAYLLEPPELWARSYEQFIGSNTGQAELHDQFRLASRRESRVAGRKFRVYWTQKDFRPIEREIKRVLQSLGWM